MIEARTFNQFKALISAKSGISLKEGKESLLEARISKRMRELGLESPDDYFDFLKKEGDSDEMVLFIDAISTNVTNFFREPQHFQVLEEVTKLWASRGQKKFRIWCAASSTGQEPYTIAMTVANSLDLANSDVKILASDICTKVLATAKKGVYNHKELAAIPHHLQMAHTRSIPNSSSFEFDEKVKSLVTYARLNLSVRPYPMSGPFDFIFCRNVMIYFDTTLRNQIATEAYRLLKPGGIFFVGHSETLTNCPVPFTTVMPSVYRKAS
jgi:chemotaxis protein methyltransferase CheR